MIDRSLRIVKRIKKFFILCGIAGKSNLMQLEDLDRIGTCYGLTPGLIRPCLSPTIFPWKTTTQKQNRKTPSFFIFLSPVVPGRRVSKMQLEDLDRIGTCYSLTSGLIHPCLSLTIFPLKTQKQNKTEKHLQFWCVFFFPVVPGSRVSMMHWRFRQNRNLLQFNTRFDSSLLESDRLPLKNNNIETKRNRKTPSILLGFSSCTWQQSFTWTWCSTTRSWARGNLWSNPSWKRKECTGHGRFSLRWVYRCTEHAFHQIRVGRKKGRLFVCWLWEVLPVKVNRTCASPVQERNSEEKASRLWEVPLVVVNKTCALPVLERFFLLQ